ncbi:MAG: adventurous gliding motility protein CglF [Deltaproteobacteria bacterium]|nr:adventurous gliding motility protein CglF [Deltaproteobacteria bacterium]
MKKTITHQETCTDADHTGQPRKALVRAGLLGLAAIGTAMFLQWAPAANAQDVQYKKKTVINFEDDTIEGSLKTPDGQYIEAKRAARHKSLIRIRSEFRREVLSSISDL